MGGYLSKEWSEVVTGNSPGSPNDEAPAGKAISQGEVARRRILNADPRSISDDVTRTPIQVDKSPNTESTPRASAPPYLDPRSPSTELPRTPIAPNPPTKNPLNLDDSFGVEPCKKADVPLRGAVIADLKEIEKRVEALNVSEKEEGEITHDETCDEAHDQSVQIVEEILKKEVMKEVTELIKDDSIIVKDESYEKEEGEITHDSDEDENDENLLKMTPKTIRGKSSLESDCRSPLLIENDEPVFEKALTSELALMAARNTARQRKPLGSASTENKDDSLVI